MGWWITAGILTLLAILPLGVSIKYSADGPLIRLILGPIRWTLIPAKHKKKEKPEDKQTKEEIPEKPVQQIGKEKPDPVPDEANDKESGGSWTDFLPLLRTALDFLGDFRRKLRVNYLQLKLIMAADDPCDLAVNYGRAWAAVGNLMPRLDSLFVIKKRDVEVECDFTANETKVIARLDLTITLGRLIAAVVCFGVKVLWQFLKINKLRKGGAKQ